MKTTRRGALVAGALGGTGLLGAAAIRDMQTAGTAYSLPQSTILRYRSDINGVDYVLYVRPPAGHESGSSRYPVIVTLDADYSFPGCATQLEHLAARERQGPEAILVSVAYAGSYPDPRGYRLNRTRDYTPAFVAEGGYGPEYQRASGGAPQFLRSLIEEALPLIGRHWRVDQDDRTLVGHSFGGLFAGWVLQTRPDSFSRYLLVSPSLWYADDLLLKQEEAGRIVAPTRPTRVFLAVGDQEERSTGGGHRMVSQLRTFADGLAGRGDPNLSVRSRVFEDETHASIFPAAFSTGVRHLFSRTPWEAEAR